MGMKIVFRLHKVGSSAKSSAFTIHQFIGAPCVVLWLYGHLEDHLWGGTARSARDRLGDLLGEMPRGEHATNNHMKNSHNNNQRDCARLIPQIEEMSGKPRLLGR